MKALKEYIDRRNQWNAIFGSAPTTFPLSQKNVDEIARQLDGDLSPENLHCDGEISVAEANRKYRFYERVYRDLEQYCSKNLLNTPAIYEL
jgi:hypothetical protein